MLYKRDISNIRMWYIDNMLYHYLSALGDPRPEEAESTLAVCININYSKLNRAHPLISSRIPRPENKYLEMRLQQ